MKHTQLPASNGIQRQVNEPGEELLTTVVALIPELKIAKVRAKDGFQYSITTRTPGVNVLELVEGQTLLCTVTRRLPRILSARALP